MPDRRQVVIGAAMTIAAPFVVKGKLNAQTPRVRRDVQSLDPKDPFFAKYGEAVKAMHSRPADDPRSWRKQAIIHMDFCVHGGLDFVHWHRHYLANFESICAQLIGDPSFALPYWNWSANAGRMPDSFYDLNDLNVESWKDPSNAFSQNWGSNVTTIGRRALRKGQGLQDDPLRGGAFTEANINAIKNLSEFDLFTGSIEGSPHGGGHVLTGGRTGHMGDGMSPLDPIFWLHHCNIDRIWAEWQNAGNSTPPLNVSYSKNFFDGDGKPVLDATSANALKIEDFNYTYDVLSGAKVTALSKKLQLDAAPTQVLLNEKQINATRQPLGADRTARTVAVRVESRFPVTAQDLLPNLFRSRTYWAPNVLGVQRLAVESNRVLARLSDVMAPKNPASILVNVFVNCPYLTPETQYSDPHYAGSFAFFGGGGESHKHSSFVIDVTRPLRALAADGRLASDRVNVQLMAVPVDESPPEGTFSVGSVELITA